MSFQVGDDFDNPHIGHSENGAEAFIAEWKIARSTGEITDMKMKHFLILGLACVCILCGSDMARCEEEHLSDFLRPTPFIDSDNPAIIAKARELTKNCKNDSEKAKALFEYVRDSYNTASCPTFVASEIMKCGGNSCRQRSILLAALCRAVHIPARLHIQKVTIKNWKDEKGIVNDMTFAHGIAGIYLDNEWHLYESVGNKDKWFIWTQDEKRKNEMPVKFYADKDCLLIPDKKIIIDTLPLYFADWTPELIALIEQIDEGEQGAERTQSTLL
jgi:hypothetical protein